MIILCNQIEKSYEIYFLINSGLATQIKPGVGKGKGKAYQVPEFFEYDKYSYFSVEKDMQAQRVPQPASGATEYWADREK